MVRTISFLRISTPDSQPVFGDPVTVYDSNGIPIPRVFGANLIEIKNTVFCFGSTWPNAVVPGHNPPTPIDGKPFDLGYGSLALGLFDGRCVFHSEYGKCIWLNEGKELPALYPNPHHEMRHVIAKMYIHRPDPKFKGKRGSAGCLTVEPDAVEAFFNLFKIDERVKVEIRGRT